MTSNNLESSNQTQGQRSNFEQAGPQLPSSEMIVDKVKVIDIPIHSDERKTKNIEISVAGNILSFNESLGR